MIESLGIPGYQIERMLAQGGMAEVYLAVQLSLGRKVAIKVLDTMAADHEFAERFLNEARLVAALNHSNLITIYDFGQLDGGKLYLTMEYLQGGDLEERLSKGLAEKNVLRIMRELASVLRFVHSNGIIHRDIKPANILFRQDDSLVLTDFGIAKKINNDVGLTQAGMMVGSAAYSSPEQMQGLELDQRADIYSVGVVFLEMLTGHNPFRADSFVNTAMNHMQMDIPLLSGRQARFQPLLDKMLAKKPSGRFASMDQLLSSLEMIVPVTGVNPVPVQTTPAPRTHSVTAPSSTLRVPPSATGSSSALRSPPIATGSSFALRTPSSATGSTSTSALDKKTDSGDSDEFLDEAMKLLAEMDSVLTAPKKSPAVAVPVSTKKTASTIKPAPGMGFRHIPDILLDDEDV